MRRLIIGLSASALVVTGLALVPSASRAAGGTGAWGDWTITPGSGSGSLTFTGTDFPDAAVSSTGQSLAVSSGASVSLVRPHAHRHGVRHVGEPALPLRRLPGPSRRP